MNTDDRTQQRIPSAVGCLVRAKGVVLIVFGLLAAPLFWFVLRQFEVILAQQDLARDASPLVLALVKHRALVALSGLLAAAGGVAALAGRGLGVVGLIVGFLALLVPFALVLIAFIQLLAPLYDVQPL